PDPGDRSQSGDRPPGGKGLPGRRRPDRARAGPAAGLVAGNRAAQLDPNPIRIFDVCEYAPSFGERRMAAPRPFPNQFVVGPLDIRPRERDVVQLVPVAIRAREELRAVRIPVQLEHRLGTATAKLQPSPVPYPPAR